MNRNMSVTRVGNKYVKRIEVKRADGSVVGSISITKSVKKKSKRLQYNYKEISTRVLRAKTSGTARQTVASARQSVVVLQKMRRTGDYDERQMRSAILHAEAIVRVAKKRMKHLQEEEEKAKKGGPCEAELEEKTEELADMESFEKEQPTFDIQELQELMRQCQELMREAMDKLERLNDMAEFSEELMLAEAGGDMDPEDLELMKKKHRAEELREIMEADMKYLKAMFEKLVREKQEANSGVGGGYEGMSDSSNGGGVALQLGGVDIPVQAPAVDAATLVEGGNLDTLV